jgi:hypothetical protein
VEGVSGANVAIIAGHETGRTAVSDSFGDFRFNTPFTCGPTTLHLTKAGYQDLIETIIVCETSTLLHMVPL